MKYLKGCRIMAKRLKRTIIVLVILGVIITSFSMWIRDEMMKKEEIIYGYRRSAAEKKEKQSDSVDLLVVGDSESYTSVSPMQLWEEQGITAYVCGQPGQKIQQTYYMLKTALQLQSPKVVILETNLMFREPGPIADITTVTAESVKNNISAFKYHTLWKSIFKGKKPGESCFKGFVLRGGISPFESGDYMKKTSKAQEIPGAVRSYMEEIRKICNKKGIFLVLMSAPSPKNYNFKKHNAIENYARENGLPYFDLNLQGKELGMDWKTDSYDKGDHLNLNGAKKVTAWVGKYLKENYDLPDHRGKPEYRAWQEDVHKYKEAIKQLPL